MKRKKSTHNNVSFKEGKYLQTMNAPWLLESRVTVVRVINMSPRFEWHVAISQSARSDETHHSFDRHFYLTAQNYFLPVNSRLPTGPIRSYTSERENVPHTWAPLHFLSDLMSVGGTFSLLAILLLVNNQSLDRLIHMFWTGTRQTLPHKRLSLKPALRPVSRGKQI